jgi:hypothetical protein
MANGDGAALLFELPADEFRHFTIVFHQQNLHHDSRVAGSHRTLMRNVLIQAGAPPPVSGAIPSAAPPE